MYKIENEKQNKIKCLYIADIKIYFEIYWSERILDIKLKIRIIDTISYEYSWIQE